MVRILKVMQVTLRGRTGGESIVVSLFQMNKQASEGK